MVKIFYVLAREKCSDKPYHFVSYERTRGNGGPIDVGINTHLASDFAIDGNALPIVLNRLSGLGYETIVA